MGRVVGQTPVHRQNIHPKGRRTAETICHDWLPQKLLSRQKGRNIERCGSDADFVSAAISASCDTDTRAWTVSTEPSLEPL